jgi:hypothetical protein
MSGLSFLRLVSGRLTEILGIQSSAGAADAGKIPALDSAGKLDSTMMPTGVGADTVSLPASENLTSGNAVNIWDDSGTAKVRKADATTAGKEAHGFVLGNVTSPANATVYLEGQLTGLAALTPGARQYLGTTPGALVETPPSGSGNVVQPVGVACNATTVNWEPQEPVTLA